MFPVVSVAARLKGSVSRQHGVRWTESATWYNFE